MKDILASYINLHANKRLDAILEEIVFGHKCQLARRPWSKDADAAHAIYDPLAKVLSWNLKYVMGGPDRGWQVLDESNNLVAKGEGSIILAMVRAVLVYHLRLKHDDGSKPNGFHAVTSVIDDDVRITRQRTAYQGIRPYGVTTSA